MTDFIKKFDMLTDEELIALTQEQLDRYIDLAKAEAGVRFIQEPIPPKEVEIPKEEKVTIWDIEGICSTNESLIRTIAELIEDSKDLVSTNYVWVAGYDNYYYIPQKPYEITTKRAVSKKVYEEYKEELIKHTEDTKQYNEDMSEYKLNNGKALEIAGEIYKKRNEAIKKAIVFDRFVREYEKYLDLANSDECVALRFFEKAYSNLGLEEVAKISKEAAKNYRARIEAQKT